jgi:hypothetical protein
MPLIVRGGLSRTFGSLAGFAALGLLSLGVYLLADAFAHPVDAEAADVILAAFVIAMAMLLLAFIFKPWKFPEMLRRKESAHIAQQRPHSSAKQLVAARRDRLRSDLPYQRTFVHRSSIRPRKPSPAQARGIAGK